MKTCTKCKKEQPLKEFYKYTHRDGYRPDCRTCRNAWTREYNKNPNTRIKRNKKGNKWAYKNADSWTGIIPKETRCQICEEKIYFMNRNSKKAIHFDHRIDGCTIVGSPTQWLLKHNYNKKNKDIWDSCNFGMLCGKCNRALPTKDRRMWVFNVMKYCRGIM